MYGRSLGRTAAADDERKEKEGRRGGLDAEKISDMKDANRASSIVDRKYSRSSGWQRQRRRWPLQ